MKRRTLGRAVSAAVMTAVVAATVSGCGWRGLNSLSLPGTVGGGAGSYRVFVQMPDVTTLTRNSPVLVDDVTVGSVSGIEVQGWHALVTVSLAGGVVLPGNVTARIGQTSLLGSTHVELAAPVDGPSVGRLVGGAVIPLDRALVYPTTEQTLSAVSVVLNGGGFAALGDITRELDVALGGRGGVVRDLLGRLGVLAAALDAQRGDIVTALVGLDRLGRVFAGQASVLGEALDRVPGALGVLVGQRRHLTDALVQLGRLSDVANRIVADDGADFEADARQLAPVLRALAESGGHITGVLGLLPTFPFPLHEYQHAAKGDYFNLFMTVDLTAKRIDSNFLTGTPLGGIWGGVQADRGGAGRVGAVADPFSGPLALPPPAPAPAAVSARPPAPAAVPAPAPAVVGVGGGR